MKREILFRVYVKLNEEGKEFYNNQSKFIESVIHNVEYLSLLHNQCVIYDENKESVITIFENYCEVYELMQFIGLLDKNGKEIFEGDIVRWDDETNGERWRVAVVEINPDIQFRIIRIECDFIQSAKEGYVFKFGRFAYKDTYNHLEIIGNIHE